MRKIYKVVIRYGYKDFEGNLAYNTDWEFFKSKKAAFEFIDKAEDRKTFGGYFYPEAKVYVLEADADSGRFWMKSNPISNFSFTGLTLNF